MTLHAIHLGVKFRIFECIFFTWDFMPSILELNFAFLSPFDMGLHAIHPGVKFRPPGCSFGTDCLLGTLGIQISASSPQDLFWEAVVLLVCPFML